MNTYFLKAWCDCNHANFCSTDEIHSANSFSLFFSKFGSILTKINRLKREWNFFPTSCMRTIIHCTGNNIINNYDQNSISIQNFSFTFLISFDNNVRCETGENLQEKTRQTTRKLSITLNHTFSKNNPRSLRCNKSVLKTKNRSVASTNWNHDCTTADTFITGKMSNYNHGVRLIAAPHLLLTPRWNRKNTGQRTKCFSPDETTLCHQLRGCS